MALNKRQALATQTYTLPAAGLHTFEFVVDSGQRLISRIKLSAAAKFAYTDLVRIEAEGEGLYSNLNVPILALFLPTDHAADLSPTRGPHVLEFDDPLVLSLDHSLKVTVTGAADDVVWCTIEGA